MPISDLIREKYYSLSTKQKQIADYLMVIEKEVSFKTLKEISTEVGVTEVTVINFCKALGFHSYSQLKEQYRKEMLSNLNPTRKMFHLIDMDGVEDILATMKRQQIKNISYTQANLPEDELDRAVTLMSKARKIYIFCRGLSQVAGTFLKIRLERLTIEVEMVDLYHIDATFIASTLRFTKDDLFIVISYPIYPQVILKTSEFLSAKGYNVIGITDQPSSPLTKYTDITFFGESDSIIFYNCMLSSISIVEILAAMLQVKMGDKLAQIEDDVEMAQKEFFDFL